MQHQFSPLQLGLPVGARQGYLKAKPRPEFILDCDDDNNLIIVPNTIRLSGCLIVRNNEHTIRPCLESLKPWVDEMIVVDTGSTDATPQIAEELGARVYHWQWRDDFATARNQSLDHARGEWIFWMDSDDTLPEECGRKLRALIDSLSVGVHALACPDSHSTLHCNPAGMSGPDTATMGYVMQVHCPGDDPHDVTVVDHVKLFRNLPELRFEFRIHEQILPAIRRANGEVAFTDIYVVHSGSDRTPHGQAGKLERDFKLLNLELADRPDHPFVLFNLGMTHADCRQFDEAIYFLNRCIEVSGREESHVRKACALLISALMQSGQYERADAACREGRSIFPDDKELLFRQAMLQHHQGRLADAISTYQQVLSVVGDRHFTSIDAGLSSFKARHNLALVHEDAGDYARAVEEWRRITESEKHYVQGWRGLIEALLKLGDMGQVDQICQRLRQESTPLLRSIAAYGQGRMSELQGDTDTALTAFAEAERLDSTDTHALRQSCRILFESGRWEEVERHLERLIEKADADASAFHNLGIARWQNGQYEPAITALRESLRLRPDSMATWEQLGLRLTEHGRHTEAAHCRDQVDRLSRSMTQPAEVLTEA